MKLFKIFFVSLLIALSFTSKGQIKITDMPTYVGNPNGGWVPIVLNNVNRKIDAKYLGFLKVDTVFSRGDTIFWRNGSGIHYFKLSVNAIDTTNKWINSIRRIPGNDSVQYFKNGSWQFAYKDSAGGSGLTYPNTPLSYLNGFGNFVSLIDTVHSIGDARYPQLSGSYANPSWITSLAWSKITSTPTTIGSGGYGISDTKANFDAALSDGNFLYVGDITQYTDEMAQDAIGAMVSSEFTYTDGTPLLAINSIAFSKITGTDDLAAIEALSGTAGYLKKTAANTWSLDNSTFLTANQNITISGDASGSGTTSIALTLATVNSNVGTFNNVTVNAKGLVTAASNVAYLTSADLSGYVNAIAGENYLSKSGGTITANAVNLSNTNVTGTLAAARFGALTGDVTNSAGSYATTVTWANGYPTYDARYATGAANLLKVDSVKTNSDSTKLFYYNNGGTAHEFYDFKSGLTGNDTTIFQTVVDSTGQPGQRILWAAGNKIKSSPYLLFDSANRKVVIGNQNISVGGTATKLYVTGNAQVTGNFTAGSLIKSGGTSSQFLKADGSVDASVYITSSALSPYELLSNKSTTTTLGTSNTLYPTQNAVKTYVDNAISGIGTPTLQQVVTAGNSSNIPIYLKNTSGSQTGLNLNVSTDGGGNATGYIQAVDWASGSSTTIQPWQILIAYDSDPILGFRNNSGTKQINLTGPVSWGTTLRTIRFPDASGTIALTSDIPSLSGYELLSNKATDFSTLNNTLYPTTQAVADYVTASIPDLQAVTDNGNTTTNNITASSFTAPSFGSADSKIVLNTPGGNFGRLQLANTGDFGNNIENQDAFTGGTLKLQNTGNAIDTVATLYDIRAAGVSGASRFGVSGEDVLASGARSFDAASNNFSITNADVLNLTSNNGVTIDGVTVGDGYFSYPGGDVSIIPGTNATVSITSDVSFSKVGSYLDFNARKYYLGSNFAGNNQNVLVDDINKAIRLNADSVYMSVQNGVSGTADSALVRNATTGRITMQKLGSGYTDEMAQDAIGAMISSDFTYTDATPLLTLDATLKSNWNAAYNDKIVSGSYSAGTITLTQQDAGTVSITGIPQGTLTTFTDGNGFDGTVTGNALSLKTTVSSGKILLAGASGLVYGDASFTFDGSTFYTAATSDINFEVYSGSNPMGYQLLSSSNIFYTSNAVTNSVNNVFKLQATTSGTVANGYGVSQENYLESSTGNLRLANQFISKWEDATDGTRRSKYIIAGVDNAVTADLFTLSGTGQPQFNKLGSGTFTGTATYNLAVDASGNIIEVATGGGSSYSFANGLEETGGVVSLGGSLSTTRTITLGAESLILDGSGSSTGKLRVTGQNTSAYDIGAGSVDLFTKNVGGDWSEIFGSPLEASLYAKLAAGTTKSLKLTGSGLQYVDGTEQNGYVLTSDGSGNASWQAPTGGGSGTVTDFSAGNLSPLFTTSEATTTTTPALTFSLSNAAAHKFFGNNTGSTGAPDYVSITAGDLPDLSGIYQPLDADLTYLAGFTPSANVKTILNAADYSAVRTALSLVIGTNVQAWDADLDTYASITPSADVQTMLGSANNAAIRSNIGAGTGNGDMLLGTIQSVTALKTYDKDKFAMKGTGAGVTTLSTANTSGTSYTATLQAATGTIAYLADITGTNSGTNTGDQTTTGTTNRITVTSGSTNPVIDIAATYVGQTSITTLGTIATGVWNGTAITDTYISSAATWNAKQDGIQFKDEGSNLGTSGTVTSIDYVGANVTTTRSTNAITVTIASQTSVTGNAGTATALQNARTLWGQSFDGTANVTGSLTAVGDITGGASNMIITAGTGNSRTLTLRTTTAGGTATAFLTGNADQSSTFGGNISGTGAWTLTGGAGNMTIISGTGASRTMIFQTTTAGSTATTALTLAADQSATFANTVNATTFVGALTGNATTASTLATSRNINGTAFNGSADITITAAAGTLTGTTLNSTVVTSSLTSVGTLTSLTMGGTLAMGTNSITMTGSIGATGARVTKGWFTDGEFTNMPTVGGTSLSTTFAPKASPTFTGTVTIPTSFVLGATTVTTTGTQLNYLNAATGTTGTTSTNLVFSTSPTLVTPNLGTPSTLVLTNATGLPLTTGVTGTLPIANGGTGQTTANAAMNALLPSKTGNSLKYLRVNTGETDYELVTLAGGGDALKADPLSQFAATTSLQLKNTISDETGSGALVFGTSPDFTTGITIGGVAVPTISSTNTLTNKRITQRVTSITSNATWSPSADNDDVYIITAQAVAVTTISNPSGTPTDGQKLIIRVKDDGTARALSWSGTQWRASTDQALPTTTTAGKVMYIAFMWTAQDSKWDCVAVNSGF